jgi:hypothetical protein
MRREGEALWAQAKYRIPYAKQWMATLREFDGSSGAEERTRTSTP